MSFPNTPPEGINPITDLDSEQVALLLLVSIAFEELGLAHMINAEAEKLQGALGTLVDEYGEPVNPSIRASNLAELLSVNREVERTLRTIVNKEMLLQFKFENILEFLAVAGISTTTSTTTTTTTTHYNYNYHYFNYIYIYFYFNIYFDYYFHYINSYNNNS